MLYIYIHMSGAARAGVPKGPLIIPRTADQPASKSLLTVEMGAVPC